MPFCAEKMIAAVEVVFGMSRNEFFGSAKSLRAIMAKEVLMLTSREAGATVGELSDITGISSGSISRRRCDAARQNVKTNNKVGLCQGPG